MWITTTTGYLSIVQGNGDPTVLVVRARVKGDLEPLRTVHATLHGTKPQVLAYEASDYPWRILTSRAAVSAFLAEQVEALDYGNFKDEVKRVQGAARASVYSGVWTALLPLEHLDTRKNRRQAQARWSRYDEQDAFWERDDTTRSAP